MTEDPRCCGSGVCIIDPDGRCWCGQLWDGQKMSHPGLGGPGQRPAEDGLPGCAPADPQSARALRQVA
jgi:hypothetical protein